MAGKVSEIDRQIAKNLRRLREQAGLTQPRVASHLNVAYQSYQKMENGRVSFRASVLRKFQLLYGVSYSSLLSEMPTGYPAETPEVIVLMAEMSGEQRRRLTTAAIDIKHEAA